MSKMLATWLFAGLSLVAIGSVYVSIFNIPHQLIKFDEFLVLFQGSVFLCAGMWLLKSMPFQTNAKNKILQK